ncbi:MAG: type II toxin-antitoxin system RelE/ParE family toxin [Anditalea sp.]
MAKLRWSNKAVDDLLEIQENAGKISEKYAMDLMSRLMEKPKILKVMPEMGRIVPEKKNPKIRELFERQFRIIYRIENDLVEIINVINSSKSLR